MASRIDLLVANLLQTEGEALYIIPVVGVVGPGARAALARAGGLSGPAAEAPIAVLATEATVASDAYGRAIRSLDPFRTVMNVACPLFVPLAEEGWTENDVARAAARLYLAPVVEASHQGGAYGRSTSSRTAASRPRKRPATRRRRSEASVTSRCVSPGPPSRRALAPRSVSSSTAVEAAESTRSVPSGRAAAIVVERSG